MFFHALTFAGPRGCCLNTRPIGWVFNIIRGTRQVLMQWNKHVWSLFLHILPYSSSIRTENAAKTLTCPFSYTGFLQTKWRRLCTFERHYVITVRNVFANKNIGEMISLVRNKCHINNAGLILSIFKFRPMFKQHVNLLIWTWIFVHLTMGVNSYTNRNLCKNYCYTYLFLWKMK